MMEVLSRLIDTISQPGNLLVLLLVLGTLLLMRGHHQAGERLIAIVAVICVAITVLPVAAWVSAPLENRFPKPNLPQRIDGIVLLGGAIRVPMTMLHGEVALNGAAERMTETLALARRYPEVPILVSGAADEAAAMRRLLVEDGVESSRILIDGRSRNTYENALYSKEIAQPHAGQIWVLVTSANAMPRAIGCFRHVRWEVLPFPVEYHSGGGGYHFGLAFAENIENLNAPIHEWIGLVAYRLLGRIDSVFPGPR